MRGSHIDVLADKDDLYAIFERFDDIGNHRYTETLSDLNAPSKQFENARPLMDFLVSYQKPIQSKVFMITLPMTELISKTVVMSDGSGVKTSLMSQDFNPDAIQILLGGEAGPTTIVRTVLRTTGETPIAKELFKTFKKAMIKGAKRLQGHYYVMPHALRKLHEGWRLTPAIDFAKMMDIEAE